MNTTAPTLFYGVPSGCSFGSIVALEWLEQPYRLSRIEMPEMVTSETYRRINPVAETPSLLTAGGQVISESLSILNHISARGIGQGIGFAQGTPEFDRLNQMLGFLNTTFFNAFVPLWHILEHGSDANEAAVLREFGRAKVIRAHALLEDMLGDQPWLLGEHKTVADAYFAGIARWTKYHDVIDRRDYPNLQRLYDKLQADPAVVFAHAIERQQPVATAGGFLGEVGMEDALGWLRQAA